MGHEFVEMKNTPAAIDAYRRAVGKRDRFDCPHYMQQFLDWNVIPRFVALILLPFLRCSSVPLVFLVMSAPLSPPFFPIQKRDIHPIYI
jgi:hypothetical protein